MSLGAPTSLNYPQCSTTCLKEPLENREQLRENLKPRGCQKCLVAISNAF